MHCIRQQSRADRSTEHFVARVKFGYHTGLPEKERRALMAKAMAFRTGTEKAWKTNAGVLDVDLTDACQPVIISSYLSRQSWDRLRLDTERQMRQCAITLPVYQWTKGVAGLGELGLAIIVGEAGGDIARFSTVSKLWKRMGVAVIDGIRQQKKKDEALAAIHLYAPKRRAEMWTLADSMFRHQWVGAKTDEDGTVIAPGYPKGPFGEVYQKRRARTAETHPEWSLGHASSDARRVMFKAVLAHFWGAWVGKRKS